jgi:TonB family protein
LDQASVQANIQGGVTLYLVIDAKGVPTKLQVIHSLSPGLDNNAIAAVSKWRFAPAAKDGKPIAYGTTIVVTYQY